MLGRMLGALSLNPSTYEEVEHDTGAIWQALLVVILVSIASGIGGLLAGETDLVRGVVYGVIRGLITWVLWATATLLVGTTILKTPQTHADWGQMARGTGFAQTPGLLNILVFIPYLSWIWLPVFVWRVAGMLLAVRESLDYDSLWRAFFVVMIALIPVLILNIVIVLLLGIAGNDGSTETSASALLGFFFL